MEKHQCKICKSYVPQWEVVNVASRDEKRETICNNCFIKTTSNEKGIGVYDYESSFLITDPARKIRKFNVSNTVVENGCYLEAVEVTKTGYGYRFAVFGDKQHGKEELIQKLKEKVTKGITTTHIREEWKSGEKVYFLDKDEVVGTIDSDFSRKDIRPLPTVIIDGKPYKWEELGEMLMTYEGFQFKLKLMDHSED